MTDDTTDRQRRRLLTMLGATAVPASLMPIPGWAESPLTPVDRALPPFELPALDGTGWSLDKLTCKPWIVNFWATWCPPCIEEMPSLNRAWQTLSPEGIGMLAINAGEGEQAVEDFLKRIEIGFPVLLGDGDTLPHWSVRALPTTLIIDPQGQVRFEVLGPREWDAPEVAELMLGLKDQETDRTAPAATQQAFEFDDGCRF